MFDLLTVSIGIGTYWEAVLSTDYCSKLYPLTRRRTLKIKPVDPFHWDCYIAILLYCYIGQNRRIVKIKPVDPFHWDCYIGL